MKLLIALLLFLFTATAVGQTEKIVERDLLQQFKRINFWRDSKDNADVYDSLEHANQNFEEALLKYTSHNSNTIGFIFKNLQKDGLSISTSEDRLFRIYSWDTWTGGTMHFF